jgi:hypothetical protein
LNNREEYGDVAAQRGSGECSVSSWSNGTWCKDSW